MPEIIVYMSRRGIMDFVLITGLSGAGKTEAVRCLEDIGYFCVDNLPPAFIPKFAEIAGQSRGKITRVAVVIDVRGAAFFEDLWTALNRLKEQRFRIEVLFLEATDEALLKRFKESHRPHPLEKEAGGLLAGIKEERKRLEELRGRGTRIIDTTRLSPRQLKEKIRSIFAPQDGEQGPMIRIMSFGYKYGLPLDADMIFDTRFLPNPYWVDELRTHDGREETVSRYVLETPEGEAFITELHRFLGFVLPHAAREGGGQLTLAVGCTGGRHRSVAVAEKVASMLRKEGFRVVEEHRDIDREEQGKNGEE